MNCVSEIQKILNVFLVLIVTLANVFVSIALLPLQIELKSVYFPDKRNYEVLTIDIKEGTYRYYAEANEKKETYRKIEKTLTAEEAIEYSQQHFNEEEAEQISEIIAKGNARKIILRLLLLIADVLTGFCVFLGFAPDKKSEEENKPCSIRKMKEESEDR